MLFFFFQAEDGIRDVAVTGVQTCALPIFVKITKIRSHTGDRQPIICQGHTSLEGNFFKRSVAKIVEQEVGQIVVRDKDVREAVIIIVGKRDRKSTRLNSSHGYISYAVFCLKKKK